MSDMPSIAAPPAALCQQMERKREGRERGGEEGRKLRGGEGDACVDAWRSEREEKGSEWGRASRHEQDSQEHQRRPPGTRAMH
jgi:hypothetical protein